MVGGLCLNAVTEIQSRNLSVSFVVMFYSRRAWYSECKSFTIDGKASR